MIKDLCSTEPKSVQPDINQYNKFVDGNTNEGINRIMIDDDIKKKELFTYDKKLIPLTPDKYVLLLESTLDKFEKRIEIPGINTLYNDIIGASCTYDTASNTITDYVPRMKFKFYFNNILKYCTHTDNIHHNAFKKNKNFIEIVKVKKEIQKELYKQEPSFLNHILELICNLFDIKGSNKLKVAKLIVLSLGQEGPGLFTDMYLMLFHNKYFISDLDNIIYKSGPNYIIKQIFVVKSKEPINNKLKSYDDKLTITYMINQNKPNLYFKIELGDIDNILKYHGIPEYKENNKINFILY
jgi:hypothetical protein